MKTAKLERIRLLENEIADLRQEINVSAPNEMLFQAPRTMWSSTDVVVEADGSGGAKLMIVEGNYPADYITHKETQYPTEDAACEAAERMVALTESRRLSNWT